MMLLKSMEVQVAGCSVPVTIFHGDAKSGSLILGCAADARRLALRVIAPPEGIMQLRCVQQDGKQLHISSRVRLISSLDRSMPTGVKGAAPVHEEYVVYEVLGMFPISLYLGPETPAKFMEQLGNMVVGLAQFKRLLLAQPSVIEPTTMTVAKQLKRSCGKHVVSFPLDTLADGMASMGALGADLIFLHWFQTLRSCEQCFPPPPKPEEVQTVPVPVVPKPAPVIPDVDLGSPSLPAKDPGSEPPS